MIYNLHSPLLTALKQAQDLVQDRHNAKTPTSSVPKESLELDHRILRSLPNHPPTQAAPTHTKTEADLARVGTQLAEVQAWLRDNPALLHLLDLSIRNEVKRMERRVNRNAILLNILFTLLGALLGLILPSTVIWLSHL